MTSRENTVIVKHIIGTDTFDSVAFFRLLTQSSISELVIELPSFYVRPSIMLTEYVLDILNSELSDICDMLYSNIIVNNVQSITVCCKQCYTHILNTLLPDNLLLESIKEIQDLETRICAYANSYNELYKTETTVTVPAPESAIKEVSEEPKLYQNLGSYSDGLGDIMVEKYVCEILKKYIPDLYRNEEKKSKVYAKAILDNHSSEWPRLNPEQKADDYDSQTYEKNDWIESTLESIGHGLRDTYGPDCPKKDGDENEDIEEYTKVDAVLKKIRHRMYKEYNTNLAKQNNATNTTESNSKITSEDKDYKFTSCVYNNLPASDLGKLFMTKNPDKVINIDCMGNGHTYEEIKSRDTNIVVCAELINK